MSEFLLSTPSLFRGIASVLDVGSSLNIYNESNTTEEADAIANKSDWNVIGKDLRIVMKSYDVK
ncbi:hypothetical protein [Anaeromusa acidaminophila]|uniref:hypothetical protein n=1 Tax=Anaeromusa acidaminophila TaxID=81464 RepID=UPI0003818176|nr:hypothetical protein [Anaeromusa acidaminophila]